MEWPPKSLPKGFPLSVVARGYIKRINGKVTWICGKKEPAEALRIYHRKAAAITSGHQPIPEPKAPPPGAVVTVRYITVRWLVDRRGEVERGDLSVSIWGDYKRSVKLVNTYSGHYSVDEWSPDVTKATYDAIVRAKSKDTAARAMSHFRQAARHAADMGWCRPLRIGDRVVAKLASRPPALMKWRLYTPAEIRTILAESERRVKASPKGYLPYRQQLHAMILLALNGGFGGTELSELMKSSVDLAKAKVVHERGKTDAEHVTPLWPETVEALRPVMKLRPGDDLLFRTREGNPWTRSFAVYKQGKIIRPQNVDNFGERFSELVASIGLKIENQSAYKLKHLACSIADAAGDPHATFVLYGHKLPGAKGHYVQIGEDRLRKVVDYVRHVLLISPLSGHPGSSPTPQPSAPAGGGASGDTPSRPPPPPGAA